MRLYDYLTITENLSGKNPEDVINLIKRHNNPKRNFLFENKFLGKTYPQKARAILAHFQLLYDIVANQINDRVLIVGFAETATALAQYFSYQSTQDGKLNVVYHLQTTREALPSNLERLVFLEEHSHASRHDIVFDKHVPEFDTILFVEDEISTGKTVLNFINLFETIRPNSRYAVASLFNWQNSQDQAIYEDLQIPTYCLLRGTLKDDINTLDIAQKGEMATFQTDTIYGYPISSGPRVGMTPSGIKTYFTINQPLILSGNTLVLGTEENMFKPMLLAADLDATFMATTRSPLTVSSDEGYYPKTGIQLPSFYNSSRTTYLYNLSFYDNILVVLEGAHPTFVNLLTDVLTPYTHNLLFITESEL